MKLSNVPTAPLVTVTVRRTPITKADDLVIAVSTEWLLWFQRLDKEINSVPTESGLPAVVIGAGGGYIGP